MNRLVLSKVVSVWSWQNFAPCIDTVLIISHILVLQEYWVLTESMIQLRLMLGAVNKLIKNGVCCFLILKVLSISQGSVFLNYFEKNTLEKTKCNITPNLAEAKLPLILVNLSIVIKAMF